MPQGLDKYAESFNAFMQAALITQILVIVGLAFVSIIAMIIILRRSSAANAKVVESVVDASQNYKVERDEARVERDKAMALVVAETKKREEDQAKYEASLDRFSGLLDADQRMRVQQLDFDRQRTNAYVTTAQALDQMRSETARALSEERTNIQAIIQKFDVQAESITSLVSASKDLPTAVVQAIKPELADMRLLVERVGIFLDTIDSTRLEFVNKLDQAKTDVINSVSTLQQRLIVITIQVSDPGLAATAIDPLATPLVMDKSGAPS